jgi:hypothetical protein
MKLKLVKIQEDYHLISDIQKNFGDNGLCLTPYKVGVSENGDTIFGNVLLIASTVFKEGLLKLNKSKIQEHLSILSKEMNIESICVQSVLKKPRWQHLSISLLKPQTNLQRPHPTFFWNEVDSTIEGFHLANNLTDKKWSDEDMLKASKYGYEFRDTTSFPEQPFEQACINNTKQYLQYLSEEKSEWDVEIATVECEMDEYCHLHKLDENQPVCAYLKCKNIKPLLINGDYVKILKINNTGLFEMCD